MMSSNYLNILQLTDPSDPERLERAYRDSLDRYQRLTRSGPLRFYRNDLLAETRYAYHQLKELGAKTSHPDPPHSGKSVLMRHSEKQGIDFENSKPPVPSAVKTQSILPGRPESLRSRSVAYQRRCGETGREVRASRQQGLTEDGFCHEVIYRLEGDLIRYDSRQELLQIAKELDIPPFRANMLIAQIVEAVRHNKLYQNYQSEKKTKKTAHAGRHQRFFLIAIAVIAITLLEYWVLRQLSGI